MLKTANAKTAVLAAAASLSFLFFARQAHAQEARQNFSSNLPSCASTVFKPPCSVSRALSKAKPEPEKIFHGKLPPPREFRAEDFLGEKLSVSIPSKYFVLLNSFEAEEREQGARAIMLHGLLSREALEQVIKAFQPDAFKKWQHPKTPGEMSEFERTVSLIYTNLLKYKPIAEPVVISFLSRFVIPDLQNDKKIEEIFGPGMEPDEKLVKQLFEAADKAKYGPEGTKERGGRVNTAWERFQKFFRNRALPVGTLRQGDYNWLVRVNASLTTGGLEFKQDQHPSNRSALKFRIPYNGRRKSVRFETNFAGREFGATFFPSSNEGFVSFSKGGSEFRVSRDERNFAVSVFTQFK